MEKLQSIEGALSPSELLQARMFVLDKICSTLHYGQGRAAYEFLLTGEREHLDLITGITRLLRETGYRDGFGGREEQEKELAKKLIALALEA